MQRACWEWRPAARLVAAAALAAPALGRAPRARFVCDAGDCVEPARNLPRRRVAEASTVLTGPLWPPP